MKIFEVRALLVNKVVILFPVGLVAHSWSAIARAVLKRMEAAND